jgi:hypothetical protein
MSKRFLVVLLLALGVVAAGTSSVALAKKHRKTVKLTAHVAQVSGANETPIIDAGTISGTFGAGALVLRSTLSGTTITSKGTVWYEKGTIDLTATVNAAVQSDGSVTYTGTGRATRGTGKFKHAKGKFTITGTSPPNDTGHATLQTSGRLTYGT